jgi:hypothetical protein
MVAEPKLNRRAFDRFKLQPMYTDARVGRICGGRMDEVQGYACDISEGGIRLELDEPLEIGECINVTLLLPGCGSDEEASRIHLACEVVWRSDELDDPIMPRIAARITKYLGDDSRRRLLQFIGSGLCARAA